LRRYDLPPSSSAYAAAAVVESGVAEGAADAVAQADVAAEADDAAAVSGVVASDDEGYASFWWSREDGVEVAGSDLHPS